MLAGGEHTRGPVSYRDAVFAAALSLGAPAAAAAAEGG